MTISETLVTIFIFCLIGVMVVGIYLAYDNVYKVQIGYNELSTNNSMAIDKILDNIKSATRVVNGETTIDGNPYTTDNDTLVLELPSVDSVEPGQPQNIISGKFDYLVYFLDGNKLKSDLKKATGSARKEGQQSVGDFVDTLVFNFNNIDYSSVNKVEIILSASKTIKNQTLEVVSQTTAELRNK